ncbi:hypothetical protein CISG_10406, partial [Coccidioides immitis RMSCC 3703]
VLMIQSCWNIPCKQPKLQEAMFGTVIMISSSISQLARNKHLRELPLQLGQVAFQQIHILS